jgi:uncharacterized membrane protein
MREFIRTVVCDTIALLVLAAKFTMFEKCPWQSDPATAIKRIALVGFPARLGASLVDSRK